jgi:FixJ family two-component response regulator
VVLCGDRSQAEPNRRRYRDGEDQVPEWQRRKADQSTDDGFLLKSSPRAHLLHAVRTAAAGDALLDPTLTRRLVETYVRSTPIGIESATLATLTDRERDVLHELVRGRSNAEIAAGLYLPRSRHTSARSCANSACATGSRRSSTATRTA